MRHICGIIVAEERARAGREGKVCIDYQVQTAYTLTENAVYDF